MEEMAEMFDNAVEYWGDLTFFDFLKIFFVLILCVLGSGSFLVVIKALSLLKW